MKIDIFKPIITSLIITTCASYSMNRFFTPELPAIHWLLSIGVFVVLSLVLNWVYIQKSGNGSFVNTIMYSSGARLLTSAVVFLIYSCAYSESIKYFTFHFMMHYIIFSLFEIIFFIKIINTSSYNKIVMKKEQ